MKNALGHREMPQGSYNYNPRPKLRRTRKKRFLGPPVPVGL
jgi:hypothetical protein